MSRSPAASLRRVVPAALLLAGLTAVPAGAATVGGSSRSARVHCGGAVRDVRVTGSSLRVRVTGSCRSITVSGARNRVTADDAVTLTVRGSSQRVTAGVTTDVAVRGSHIVVDVTIADDIAVAGAADRVSYRRSTRRGGRARVSVSGAGSQVARGS